MEKSLDATNLSLIIWQLFSVLIFILFLSACFQFFRKTFFLKKYRNDFNTVTIGDGLKRGSKEFSSEIENKILKGLKIFEDSEGYINNELTLSVLAKKLNTNKTYLSAVINANKNCNFSSYIKNIRIEYAYKKIRTDRRFREYTIKAIAIESGFKSGESFSKEFYKKYNVYPSSFIRKIKKELS